MDVAPITIEVEAPDEDGMPAKSVPKALTRPNPGVQQDADRVRPSSGGQLGKVGQKLVQMS